MSDEFDDLDWPSTGQREVASAADGGSRGRDRTARLLTRLLRSADATRRSRALSALLRPLSTLSLAAVAAGAFGRHLHRADEVDGAFRLANATAYTHDQVVALVRFVLEVNPDVVAQVTDLLADNPASMATFSASVLVLLHRRIRRTGADRPAPGDR